MEIFRFSNPHFASKMENGEVINGLKSKMWIERYRKEGEFTFVAPASPEFRNLLPIGSFVSHVNTGEIMIVENHEVNEEIGKEGELTITGRSFDTILEQRMIGSNQILPRSTTLTDYSVYGAGTWIQAVELINFHIVAGHLYDTNFAIPYVTPITTIPGVGAPLGRSFKRGDVYSALLELLAIDNLGIRSVRPGYFSPLGTSSDVALEVYKGTDRSATIVYDYDFGEVKSADYLWSNKQVKNVAYVSGKWVELATPSSAVGLDRRVMYVDASDIDQGFTSPPVNSGTIHDLTDVLAAMQIRGLEALASQKDVVLTKPELISEAVNYSYRTDFWLGDQVMINGDFGEVAKMRITEYVEIEDDKGETGYPTLTLD